MSKLTVVLAVFAVIGVTSCTSTNRRPFHTVDFDHYWTFDEVNYNSNCSWWSSFILKLNLGKRIFRGARRWFPSTSIAGNFRNNRWRPWPSCFRHQTWCHSQAYNHRWSWLETKRMDCHNVCLVLSSWNCRTRLRLRWHSWPRRHRFRSCCQSR